MINRYLECSEAIEALNYIKDLPHDIARESLKELENCVSVSDSYAIENATTYLYSGGNSRDMANTISKNEGVNARIIDNTEFKKFLVSEEYKDIVSDLYGEKANTYLHDSKDGAWARGSERFIKETKGEIECVVSNAKLDRVWRQTELPKILENENIVRINGISREHIIEKYNQALKSGLSKNEALDSVAIGIIQNSKMRSTQYFKELPPIKHIIQEEPHSIPHEKQLRDLKKEYSTKNQEMQLLDNIANQMKTDLDEICKIEADIADTKSTHIGYFKKRSQIKELEISRKRAHEIFLRRHNTEPTNAPKVISDLKEQAVSKRQALEPLKEKIDTMQKKVQQQEIRKRATLGQVKTLAKSYGYSY